MKKHFVIMLLVVFTLAGCASMETVMDSWTGKSIDDVTAMWGAPESVISRNDGGATYTWKTFRTNNYGIHECRQSFVTNSNGSIVSWSYNNCPRFVKT